MANTPLKALKVRCSSCGNNIGHRQDKHLSGSPLDHNIESALKVHICKLYNYPKRSVARGASLFKAEFPSIKSIVVPYLFTHQTCWTCEPFYAPRTRYARHTQHFNKKLNCCRSVIVSVTSGSNTYQTCWTSEPCYAPPCYALPFYAPRTLQSTRPLRRTRGRSPPCRQGRQDTRCQSAQHRR